MFTASSVYHRRIEDGPDRGLTPLQRQMRREYGRDLHLRGTASLLEELESRRWQLVKLHEDLQADPNSWQFRDGSVALLEYKVPEIESVLAERERLRSQPGAPQWRTGSPDRYEATKAHAEAIKRNCPIDAYCIMAGIELQGGGDSLRGRCPLHGGDSFTVTISKGLWHCWGCGEGGDVISLHEALTQPTTFAEVVADLGRLVGIEPPDNTTPTNGSPRSRPPRDREGRNNSRRRGGVRLVGGKVMAA